jgi:hypothetical protein
MPPVVENSQVNISLVKSMIAARSTALGFVRAENAVC